jgi:hypothetical protein
LRHAAQRHQLEAIGKRRRRSKKEFLRRQIGEAYGAACYVGGKVRLYTGQCAQNGFSSLVSSKLDQQSNQEQLQQISNDCFHLHGSLIIR